MLYYWSMGLIKIIILNSALFAVLCLYMIISGVADPIMLYVEVIQWCFYALLILICDLQFTLNYLHNIRSQSPSHTGSPMTSELQNKITNDLKWTRIMGFGVFTQPGSITCFRATNTYHLDTRVTQVIKSVPKTLSSWSIELSLIVWHDLPPWYKNTPILLPTKFVLQVAPKAHTSRDVSV